MSDEHDKTHGEGIERELHDPISDKLVPLEPLDLSKIHTVDDLVRAMGHTAFTGRQVGEGADVLEAMARDKDCFVVMTLAGAMTVAKQGLIVTDLIDRGIVKAIVSTGALMAHGLVEAAGRSHFRYDPKMDDIELYEAGYNRVYDTLEPETNLDFVETIVARILKAWDHNEVRRSYKLNREIGKLPERARQGARHPEVGVREECAGIRAGLQRFGDRPGCRPAQPHAAQEQHAAAALRSVRRPGILRRHAADSRSGWGSSPSAAACRATGRSSSGRSSNCVIAAAAKTCR